ncbi:NADH-quinone oxidoreductase subunit J [Helicobacter monodelphidis]|uniref:NADH-quinone oxidoreductase subunit J n=1 Tax=Helicobacter sp. 15-1451 TaxID=2004995 RepID=UPI0026C90E4B
MEIFAFYFFGALSLAMFCVVVTTQNLLYALVALAAGMIFISPVFFLLGADFIGIAQIIVYTGAVVVVYAFSLMFFDSNRNIIEKRQSKIVLYCLGTLFTLLLLAVMIIAPILTYEQAQTLSGGVSPLQEGVPDGHMIGYQLFTQYLIPFELAAIMLLVAMIAGIILAGKRMDRSLTLISDQQINEELHTHEGGHL